MILTEARYRKEVTEVLRDNLQMQQAKANVSRRSINDPPLNVP